MKKNDFILIAVILVVTLLAIGGIRIWQKNNTSDAAVAVVTIDGEVYGEYPLSEDVTEKIEIPGAAGVGGSDGAELAGAGSGAYNVLVIEDGYADVIEASCPDQICVHHNHIKYSGESIVCLPNKLIVEIRGGEDNGIDGSTY